MPITSFTNVHEFRTALLVHPIPHSIHHFHPSTIFHRSIGGFPLPPVAIESCYFLAGTFPLPFSLHFSVWEANPKLFSPQSFPLHPKLLVNGILLFLALYLQQLSRYADQLITNVLKGNHFLFLSSLTLIIKSTLVQVSAWHADNAWSQSIASSSWKK